ncbi:hypothetical protein RQP46_008083 [Phenoliferia psychrophenolica]
MFKFWTLSLISLLLLSFLLLWTFRAHLLRFLPSSISARVRQYAPVETFESALENGFSTSNFDLSANLSAGDRDARAGLDERTLTDVRRIMESQNVGFDEGRRILVERHFRKNGIDPNGFPIDPKAITSLS